MAKSNGAVAASPAPAKSEPEVREFVAPTSRPKEVSFAIPEDNGPDFFGSLIGVSGRAYSKSELTPAPRDDKGKFVAKDEPKAKAADEESTPARYAAPPEPKEEVADEDEQEEAQEEDDDIDTDAFAAVLQERLQKEEEASKPKKAPEPTENSESAAAAWAGVIGKSVPLGKTLGELPVFALSDEVADAISSGDVKPLVEAINSHNTQLAGFLLDNAFHANALRIQSAQAQSASAAMIFEDFLNNNRKYRGQDYQEAIGLAIQFVEAKNPGIGLREALEKAKPFLDESVEKARRIAKKDSKTPAVVDQTGTKKGAGFKAGATRTRNAAPAPTGNAPAKQFKYVSDPYAFLMGD